MGWRYWVHRRRCEHYLLNLDARRRIMRPKPKDNRVEWGLVIACVVLILFAQTMAWVRASDPPCPAPFSCAKEEGR